MTQHNTTLGFEIEYLRGANIDTVLTNIREAGRTENKPSLSNVSDQRRSYNTTFYTDRWVQAYDCSCGWEIKSQPLTDTAEVQLVMKAIRQAGGRVDRTCGLHVHMDVNSLTQAQKNTLVKLYLRYENAMDQLLPGSRRGRTTYASSNTITCQPTASNFAAIDGARDVDALTIIAQRNGRYSKLNMQCFHSKGTFEFRGHQGSLNFRKIDAWASILGALYNACQQVTDVVAEVATFDEMLDELLPFAPGVRAARTYNQPRPGTKGALIWDACDALLASDRDAHLTTLDGRDVLAHQTLFAGLVAADLNLTLANARTQVYRWMHNRQLHRTVSGSLNTLKSYLRRRRSTLAR